MTVSKVLFHWVSRGVMIVALMICVCRSEVQAQTGDAKPIKIAPENTPLISVGPLTYSLLDLHYERAVDACYGDTIAGLEAATLEVVGKALEKIVIKQAFHQEAPLGALLASRTRMFGTTRDSARLSCIASVFGADTMAFLRMVVEPTLVNPRLHAYFAVDTAIHKLQRDTIELCWNLVKLDPNALSKLTHDTVRISKGVAPTSDLQKLGAVPESDDPLVSKVISKLKPGQMWQNVIEDDYSYRILKLLYETDNYYYCLVKTVLKKPFDPWFHEFVREKVLIVFRDPTVERAIKLRYPEVWWLEFAKSANSIPHKF